MSDQWAKRDWILVCVALTLTGLIMALITLYPLASPKFRIDGDFSDWYSVPIFSDPANDTLIRIEGFRARHEFGSEGAFQVSLVIADTNGHPAYWNTTILVPNEPPIPRFQAKPENLSVSFDASGSLDPDGTVVSWMWRFGDGGSASGKRVDHTYPWSGNFSVILTTEDDRGATAETSAVVRVIGPNHPPFPRINVAVIGENVTASAEASYDPDGQVVNYTWRWGDGKVDYDVTAQHTYASPGNFSIKLSVRDDGGLSANTSLIVRIPNQLPIPAWSETVLGRLVVFNATSSTDPDGALIGFQWAFGDGDYGEGGLVSHVYPFSGTFAPTLVVIDDQGGVSFLSRSVKILEESATMSPAARFETNITGLLLQVNGSSSYDPGGRSLDFLWSFGDGGSATGAVAHHLYRTAGIYAVALDVLTPDERTSRASITVVVGTVPTDSQPPEPVVQVQVTGRVAILDASASRDIDGQVAYAQWNIFENRPDLDVLEIRAEEDSDYLFFYMRVVGMPMSPPGNYRVLLDTGVPQGLERDGLTYTFQIALELGGQASAKLLRYAGRAPSQDRWVEVNSLEAASDGLRWEVGVPLSALSKPSSMMMCVESLQAGSVVDETSPYQIPAQNR